MSKGRIRWLCILLAVALFGGALGVCLSHGEWWFALRLATRQYPEPALIPLIETGETKSWTLEELALAEGVTLSKDLFLVNRIHPLPEGYVPELAEYNGAKMHPRMVDAYVALRDAVQERTGVRIYVSSDYRTAEEQEQILAESEAGIAAPVGCSEHEAGLALDVYAPYHAGEDFLASEAGRLVNSICQEYGYIIRYPKGKEEVTGFSYEPWHLRYVGVPHAEIIMESGLTLEEYLDCLTLGQWYRHGEYLIRKCAPEDLTLITGWRECNLSPDNEGNYVVTLKMS